MKEIKALKLYLPAKERFEDFYKIVDYAAHLKYNTLILEIGGGMEYKLHPEINVGGEKYTAQFKEFSGKSIQFQDSFDFPKNSIHWENAGGSYLSQDDVKMLLQYCRNYNFDVIPEVPLLSHSDYLLTEHKEFAENQEDPWPDSYCPENENVYALVFDVLDEIISVFAPTVVHIGHDEWVNFGLCEKCKKQNAAELFAKDIRRIYDYLKEKNIRTMMWGDKLLPLTDSRGVTWGGARCIWFDAKTHKILTRYLPATCQAIDLIPNDIIIMHWSWVFGEKYLQEFLHRGFSVVLGNYYAHRYFSEKKYKGKIAGFCVSNWANVDVEHFQRGNIFFNMALASCVGAGNTLSDFAYRKKVVGLFKKAYRYFNQDVLRGNFLEICHRTDVRKEHAPFVDGNYIDKEADCLGEYIIEYENGDVQKVPVYYNLNVGQATWQSLARTKAKWETAYASDEQFFETFGRCELVNIDGKIYYKIVLPCLGMVKTILKVGKDIQTLYIKRGKTHIPIVIGQEKKEVE